MEHEVPISASPAAPGSDLNPRLAGLIERFRGPLVGLARSFGAEDPAGLAQDVFAEAWMGRERFRGDWDDDAQAGPWLRGIAFHLHRNETRRRARRSLSLAEAPEPTAADAGERDRGADVRAAIDRLPGELRTVVRMHYLERTSVRAVAALLSVTEKTVEGRLYRARKELARRLATDAEKEAKR